METPKWMKWLFGVVVFIAATVGVVWLSGFFFFLFSKANPFGKTDFSTWWTYWQFYQNDAVVAKRLTALRPDLKIIFISGLTDVSTYGVTTANYLKKPFESHELLEKVRELLDG